MTDTNDTNDTNDTDDTDDTGPVYVLVCSILTLISPAGVWSATALSYAAPVVGA